jgi:hypothetical protein
MSHDDNDEFISGDNDADIDHYDIVLKFFSNDDKVSTKDGEYEVRLNADNAEKLLDFLHEELDNYIATRESVRRDYAHYKKTGVKPSYVKEARRRR